MPETTQEIVRYQWIKGEDQGKVETLIDNKGKFLIFESGNKCNKQLIGEYIQKIDMDNPVLVFEDPLAKRPKPKPGEVAAKAVEVAKNMESFRDAVNQSRQPLPESPTIAIIEKAKTRKTKLNVRMNCDLPNKAFIKVLEESFNEDVIEMLAIHLVSKIEDPEQFLIDNLKGSISEWYKYNNKTTKGESK
tara:strand:+ start:403 stop:972 length:570 start_codon:yes stop_codon:yes gene_type:complete